MKAPGNRSSLGLLGAVLAITLFSASLRPAFAAGDYMVTVTAKGNFDATVTELKKAITANQLVLIKDIPFQQMLKMAGVNSEPVMSFEIFHPRYGKVIYENDKNAFIVAPLRIVVHEKSGKVVLSYRKPSAAFAGYSGLSRMATELDGVFDKIVKSAAK